MAKIKIEELNKLLSSDVVNNKACIEMNFCIDDDTEYDDCWLGKMYWKHSPNQEIYWYGLVADGSQAYEYNTLGELFNAKVFHGKSMSNIIENVTWYSLDGCDVEERLNDYRPNRSVPINIG